MIKIIVKYSEQEPLLKEVDSIDQLEEIMEGDFEIAQDDGLSDIYILVNEEARGMKPHNFTIRTEGTHDWVYGTSLFISMEGDKIVSLTDDQVNEIKDYFAKTRAYK